MSELLLELLSEEIPARMQLRASEDLKRLVVEGLKTRGLETGEARAYSTPRRLTLVVDGVPAKSPAISEEKKGPRVGAPEQAVQGFLKSAGLASISDATVVKDEKKGDYYVARIDKPGRPAAEIIAETVDEVANKFPWPKSMRWVRAPSDTGKILDDLGNRVGFAGCARCNRCCACSAGQVVPFEIAGLEAGNETRGHRFLGPGPFKVKNFADYEAKLAAHHVKLDPAARAAAISEQAHALAKHAKLELIEDEALLAENAGLTEWPVVLMGSFDKSFLEVPGEVLTTSMKTHQKCFSLREPRTKKLANKFLLVANLVAKDGGAEIVSGNEKVIRARLSDAKFFWEQDLKHPLGEMAGKLSGITFHEKLGTQKDRVERIEQLAFELAGACDADPADARRAAGLCQGRSRLGDGRRVPRIAGPDGPLLRRARRHQARDRPRHRAALQAEGPDRRRAARGSGRRGGLRRGARRQARHARRLLGHRRKADGLRRSLSAPPRRARRDPHRAGE